MLLSEAFLHFRAGSWVQAERAALSLLKRDTRNVDALLLLADMYAQSNRLAECLDMLKRAQALRPGDDNLAYNLATALSLSGRHEQAVSAYRKVLALDSSHMQARMNLAASLMALGQAQQALPELSLLRDAHPQALDVFLNYVSALIETADFEAALQVFDHVPMGHDQNAEIFILKGRALNGLRRYREAAPYFETALRIAPDSRDALNGRAVALMRQGDFESALPLLLAALSQSPSFVEAHLNLGSALHHSGCFEDALAAYDHVIKLAPHLSNGRYNKALCCLLLGQFQQGWALYEARKTMRPHPRGVNTTKIRDLRRLSEVRGRTVLVDSEQGLGDTIQFCRLAKTLADTGAQVTLRVQSVLQDLISRLDARIRVVSGDVSPDDFRFHVSLMSLPGLLDVDVNHIPDARGYLSAEPARLEEWRGKIGSQGFRIGIAWQGNKQAQVDLGRSFSLAQFRDIAALPDVRLISLQKNDGAEELAQWGEALGIETLGPDFDSGAQAFLDTAAVMQSLDLIITSDTAIAHLAGALGQPVWVALQHVPDWRWLLHRTDSPWYASMRLFRQKSRGDWAGVFEEMREALGHHLPRR